MSLCGFVLLFDWIYDIILSMCVVIGVGGYIYVHCCLWCIRMIMVSYYTGYTLVEILYTYVHSYSGYY